MSKRNTILFFIAMIAIAAFAIYNFYSARSAANEVRTALMRNAMLVDVRSPEEFAEGSAPGAVNIPVDRIEQNTAAFKDKEQIVVFCRSGNRSARAKTILAKHGITNVINGGSVNQVRKAIQEQPANRGMGAE